VTYFPPDSHYNTIILHFFHKHINLIRSTLQGFLKDTVGKQAKGSKMGTGGWHVSENAITLADAGRDKADWARIVE
jgi:hypothetical protein